MVKRIVFAMVVIVMFSGKSQVDASVVFNGSFEYDGQVSPITSENTPERWFCDANLPSVQFGGAVSDVGWVTDGNYSLALYSYDWEEFDVNDMATISQWVYLEDVNEIIFDVNLWTNWDEDWDPNKRRAVLLIDDEPVWESNYAGSDIRGEYFESCVVASKYKTPGAHKLSLGLRADEYELLSPVYYRVRWDSVRFDTHCEGVGYLPGDISLDCGVEWTDLAMMTEVWLEPPPAARYDLIVDGKVNLGDFAVLAENWSAESPAYGQDDGLLAMDLNNDGIINFVDFAMLAERRDLGEIDYDDIFELADNWLETNWLNWSMN